MTNDDLLPSEDGLHPLGGPCPDEDHFLERPDLEVGTCVACGFFVDITPEQ